MVAGYVQPCDTAQYFDSIFDYNCTVHSNGSSSNVTKSRFMVFGRISYLNLDGTVVPETNYELDVRIAIHDNLLRTY